MDEQNAMIQHLNEELRVLRAEAARQKECAAYFNEQYGTVQAKLASMENAKTSEETPQGYEQVTNHIAEIVKKQKSGAYLPPHKRGKYGKLNLESAEQKAWADEIDSLKEKFAKSGVTLEVPHNHEYKWTLNARMQNDEIREWQEEKQEFLA